MIFVILYPFAVFIAIFIISSYPYYHWSNLNYLTTIYSAITIRKSLNKIITIYILSIVYYPKMPPIGINPQHRNIISANTVPAFTNNSVVRIIFLWWSFYFFGFPKTLNNILSIILKPIGVLIIVYFRTQNIWI